MQGLRHPVHRIHRPLGRSAAQELEERDGFDVHIGRGEQRRTKAKIKEVGPWNRRDDY